MYDFSGISTEELRYAVDRYISGKSKSCCDGFNCYNGTCPIYQGGGNCHSTKEDKDKRHNIIIKELNRREEDMNEMPELNELGFSTPEFPFELWKIKDGRLYGMVEYHDKSGWGATSWNLKKEGATEYYGRCGGLCGFDLTIKKSDNDVKIEALQQSMANLEDNHSKAVAEIKNQMEGLKSE